MIRLATSIVATDFEEVLRQARVLQTKVDILELRADFLEKITLQFLKKIRASVEKRLIFTLRDKKEGGRSNLSLKKRVFWALKAQEIGFDFVDFEYFSFKELREKEKRSFERGRLILSYHNFKETESYERLYFILKEMKFLGAEVAKLAVMVKKEDDIFTLFRLMTNFSHKRIIIGMGEKGSITRILAPVLGCYLTFASNEFSSSAPGQVRLEKLRRIYKELGMDR